MCLCMGFVLVFFFVLLSIFALYWWVVVYLFRFSSISKKKFLPFIIGFALKFGNLKFEELFESYSRRVLSRKI